MSGLSKAERDEIIDTGRHVYGCCSDSCEYHGLPEDAQIVAVERIVQAHVDAAVSGSAGMEPCAEYGQHPRGGHQSARRAAEIRGRTSDCLPFCQGGLHEEGCAALRDATHTDTPEVTP